MIIPNGFLHRTYAGLLALGFTASGIFISLPAHATLMGQTIGCSIISGLSANLANPTHPVVGPGIECTASGGPSASVNFFEDNGGDFVEIYFALADTRVAFDFTELYWNDGTTNFITGLNLIEKTGGVDPEFSYTDHSIHITWTPQDGLGHSGKFAIETPAPTPVALMALGFLGVYFSRRRRAVGKTPSHDLTPA